MAAAAGWAPRHLLRALKLACTRLMMAWVRASGDAMACGRGEKGGRRVRGAGAPVGGPTRL